MITAMIVVEAGSAAGWVKELLAEHYIVMPNLIAGLIGGMVKALVFDKARPGEVVTTMIAGGFTANYSGETLGRLTNIPIGLACFIIGMAAMMICQAMLVEFAKRIPFVKSNGKTKAVINVEPGTD